MPNDDIWTSPTERIIETMKADFARRFPNLARRMKEIEERDACAQVREMKESENGK